MNLLEELVESYDSGEPDADEKYLGITNTFLEQKEQGVSRETMYQAIHIILSRDKCLQLSPFKQLDETFFSNLIKKYAKTAKKKELVRARLRRLLRMYIFYWSGEKTKPQEKIAIKSLSDILHEIWGQLKEELKV